MNILMISSYLPYPLFDGGTIRLYNLLRELQKNHSVTLICEKRPRQTHVDVKAVEKICTKVITVPRRKQWSVANILKTGISQQPFLITGHTLPHMQNAINQELLEKKYDIIHVETSYVFQNLPEVAIPIVLVEHNIEYMVYQKFMQKAPIFLRPLLAIDIAKLKKTEESFWRRATQVVAVSDLEKSIIDKTGVKAKVVYNGVDLAAFQFKNIAQAFTAKERQFLFIGNYKWLQNRDAARFILQEVWPKIKEKASEKVVLRIVGRDMPDDIKTVKDDSIVIEENSSRKTAEIFSESFALLAPIRIGGGSQYKILESLAVGTPTITTSLGLSGLDVRQGKDLLVGDTAEALAEQARRLLNDQKLYKELADNGRKQIEEKYDWSAIAKTLEGVYQAVV